MIELVAGVPEQILFVDPAGRSPWELTLIQDLSGTEVGWDDSGAPISYPLAMTAVPDSPAFSTPPIQILEAGKYVVTFTTPGHTPVVDVMEVAESVPSGQQAAQATEYVTLQQLIERIGYKTLVQLTNDDDGSTIDMGPLTEAIDEATAEVDGYLAKRYNLPLGTVPRIVTRVTVDVVRYLINQRRAKMPEEVQKAYDRTVKILERIATGDLSLGIVPAPAQNPGKASVLTSGDRVFTRENLGAF